jgi:hypothetical protein
VQTEVHGEILLDEPEREPFGKIEQGHNDEFSLQLHGYSLAAGIGRGDGEYTVIGEKSKRFLEQLKKMLYSADNKFINKGISRPLPCFMKRERGRRRLWSKRRAPRSTEALFSGKDYPKYRFFPRDRSLWADWYAHARCDRQETTRK